MEKTIVLNDASEAHGLLGTRDEYIPLLEGSFKVKIHLRQDTLKVTGTEKNLKMALVLIGQMLEDIRSGRHITKDEIHTLICSLKNGKSFPEGKGETSTILSKEQIDIGFSFKGKIVGPRSPTQRSYLQAIKDYDIVFAIGPAGTGKTYLAMAMAVEALRKGYVRRIILTRPAIEAGESLGYLPGTLYEKILPYLRPLYDALYDMMDAEQIEKYIEMGTIEVAPLAYMRGRTLNDAFVILDEAQNCTVEQLKMFLTRLGFDSKTVITGDLTQSDLPGGKPVGLFLALDILKTIKGIQCIRFSGKDVVRHELVQRIIAAYEKLSTAH